jgi:hypothetical protein
MFYTTAAVALVLLLPCVLRAQDATTQSMRDARRNERESRQRALWDLEREAHKPTSNAKRIAAQRLAFLQIKEDFEMLQVASYSLSDAIGSGSAPDYGQVIKQAVEVKKRAARLKTNLSLPEPEKDEKQKKDEEIFADEHLKTAATDLLSLVQSFVLSPVFQQPGVLDAQHSIKAGRELERIIRLSEQIRKGTETLSKAAGKGL